MKLPCPCQKHSHCDAKNYFIHRKIQIKCRIVLNKQGAIKNNFTVNLLLLFELLEFIQKLLLYLCLARGSERFMESLPHLTVSLVARRVIGDDCIFFFFRLLHLVLLLNLGYIIQ